MVKFLSKLLLGALAFAVIIFCIVNFAVPDQFDEAYQKGLLWQHQRLGSIRGVNKLMVVGSSSLAFGFDQYKMAELAGMPCQSVGNTVATGLRYPLQVARGNATAGDIIVIEFANQYFTDLGGETILTAAERDLGMYRYFMAEDILPVAKAFPIYANKKLTYWLTAPYKAQGAYSAHSMDENGQMVMQRDEALIPQEFDEKRYGVATWTIDFDPAFIKYLNDYAAECSANGIDVYMTVRPTYAVAVRSTDEEITAFEQALQAELDFPLVSTALDYIYGREYIYDGIYHCNTTGALKRTEQLYADLKEAGAL